MGTTGPDSAAADINRVREIDRVCDAFEAAWRDGGTPELEEFLARVPAELRSAAFVELLLLDLAYRTDRGTTVSADEYARRFPEFHEEISDTFVRRGSTLSRADTLVAVSHSVESNVPKRLGDYELLGEIGRGGMGVVFKARQISLDRIVALKVIRGDGLLGNETVWRFQTEARAAAGLQHPGIVQVHDVGVDGPFQFFSMEYVEGETLSDVCARGGMSSEQAARSLVALCAAVDYAHDQGILHRDLKPSNVLVDRSGRLRIADFGLAKHMGAGTMTSIGQVLGTPGYMSPEQALGDLDRVDRHSDVYSLGAVLFALLTGRPPFQGKSPTETIVQVIRDEPPSPRQRNPHIDRALDRICRKCLSKDLEARYPTAAALRSDLERFLAGESDPGDGDADDARRNSRRTWIAGAVAATLLAVIAAAIAIPRIWKPAANSRSQSTAPADTPRPTKRPLHPGAPDPTFGVEGIVRHEFGKGGMQDAYAVIVQPDGKIVTAGQVERSRAKASTYMAVARFLPDGTLDKSFNTTGKLILWFGVFDDGITGRALVLQPDGCIVFGGRAEVSAEGYDFGLARLKPDGTMDESFGGRGLVTTDVTGKGSVSVDALALQPDGKIVAVGHGATYADPPTVGFALVRYLPDGSIDTGFGTDGRAIVDFPGDLEEAVDVVIQADGKIAATGRAAGEGMADSVILRLHPDGTPDESFGQGGRVVRDFGKEEIACVLAPQGQKLVVQMSTDNGQFLIRLNDDGSVDPAFGGQGNGKARLEFQPTGFAFAPDGTIVAPDPNGHRLVVLSADGVRYASYGPPQGSPAPALDPPLVLRDMVRASDGKLVFCGLARSGDGASQWIVMRLLGPP